MPPLEILIHTAAPSRAGDDAIYREQARAYLAFSPARRVPIVAAAAALGGDRRPARGPLHRERTRARLALVSPAAVDGEDKGPVPIPIPIRSFDSTTTGFSFRSVQDNVASPEVRPDPASPSRAESQSVQKPSVRHGQPVHSARSVIEDSFPDNDLALGPFCSPGTALEYYLRPALSPPQLPTQTHLGESIEVTASSPILYGPALEACPPLVTSAAAAAASSPSPPEPTLEASLVAAAASSPPPPERIKKAAAPVIAAITSSPPQWMFPRRKRRRGLAGLDDGRRPPPLRRADSEPAAFPPPASSSSSPPVPPSSPPPSSLPSPPPLARTYNDLSGTAASLSATEIHPPLPPVSLAHLSPADLVTPGLAGLAAEFGLARRFRPRAARPPRDLERGYWLVDMRAWPDELCRRTWVFLHNYVGGGVAGWGVWCARGGAARARLSDWLRVYCWGCVAGHVWVLLHVAAQRAVRISGASWIGADGEAVYAVAGKPGDYAACL